MPQIPDSLVLRRHRDLAGRRHQVWARRGILFVLGLIPLLGLFNDAPQALLGELGE